MSCKMKNKMNMENKMKIKNLPQKERMRKLMQNYRKLTINLKKKCNYSFLKINNKINNNKPS